MVVVTGAGSRLCPACDRPVEEVALACESCGSVVDVRGAEGPLQRALDAAEEESAQVAVARALVEIPELSSQRYVRDWLLKQIPMSHSASTLVELLGRIDDAEARAEATRLAVENFREKKLTGRWEVALARVPTPEARRALLTALTDKDDTARWTAAHAIVEHWEETPAEAIPVLRRVLRNRREHDEILFCAAAALARCDDPESRKEFLPRLLKAIRDLEGANADEFPPPTRAAVLLCGVSDAGAQREAVQFLAERLPNGAEPILALALPPLLEAAADWLVAAMLHGCRSRHPRSPSAGTLARAFGDLGLPRLRIEAWERLREAIGDAPSSAEQPYCLTLLAALGHLRRPEALPYLEALKQESEDTAVREAARESLARIGDRSAVADFVSILSAAPPTEDASRLAWVRGAQRAVEVLADVRSAAARPLALDALVRALQEPAVAREAACGLVAFSRAVVEGEAGTERLNEAVSEHSAAAPPDAEAQAPRRAGQRPPSLEAFLMRAASREQPQDAAVAEREHRLVLMLEDVQRQVGSLPHRYFRYQRMSAAERGEKEQTLRNMVLGPMKALMDATQAVTAAGTPPESGPTLALAHYLQGRVHHALACDLGGRDSHSGDPRYHQRWENLNRAEESYRRAIEATDIALYRARSYFDLAVLMAESHRRVEAVTAFEAVIELDLSGSLGQAAEENLQRLETASSVRPGHSPGRSVWRLPRTLTHTALAASLGVAVWFGWSQMLHPVGGEAALWPGIGSFRLPVGKSLQERSTPSPRGSVAVTVRRLRVRSGQGTEHSSVETVRRGERLTVIGEAAEWWKVRLPDGRAGWVAQRHTGPLQKEQEEQASE